MMAKFGDPATALPMYGRGYRFVRSVGPDGARADYDDNPSTGV